MKISMSVQVDVNAQKHVNKIMNDRGLWIYAATQWHKLYKPYVPKETGALRDTVIIRPKEIEHTAPYAHYQYTGEVYGPNYPIYQNGIHTGFYSTPNRKKKPTGKKLKYRNPKASKEWDKKAESTQKHKLISSLQGYINSGRVKLDE